MRWETLEDALIEYVHRTRTYVAVVPHGSNGCQPMDVETCGAAREDATMRGCTACVSGSGDALCGSYMGHVGRNVVVCAWSE